MAETNALGTGACKMYGTTENENKKLWGKVLQLFFSNKIDSVATGCLQCGNLIEINCKHKIYTEFQGQFEKRNIKYLISYF